MSQVRILLGAPGDVARHTGHLEPSARLWSGVAEASGLVVDGRVEDGLADGLAGACVGDVDHIVTDAGLLGCVAPVGLRLAWFGPCLARHEIWRRVPSRSRGSRAPRKGLTFHVQPSARH